MNLKEYTQKKVSANYPVMLAAARDRADGIADRLDTILTDAGATNPTMQGLLYLGRLVNMLDTLARDLAIPHPAPGRDMSTNATDNTFKKQGVKNE
jgi:hypothetical protein